MRLQSLELTGFKSFAKKTTLSFDVPITAIVGPNGSGKSNVAEGLRFSLAEQSMKSMRGKRGEDLIFSGTASVPRANRASVAMTFDNRDRFFEHIDFDTVVLERVVYRDGANDYLINGGKVRLKDVQELLARANVGETGHHIVSQGEADRVLSAHPRERRSMIEEALGLRYYQYKKAEAEKKLEKTEENIRQVRSLRKEIAPHLTFLASQVERLEKYSEMKKDLVELYRTYFAREEAYLSREQARLATNTEDIEKKLHALVETEQSEDASNEYHEDYARKSAPLEAELEMLRGKERELVGELGKLEGALLAFSQRSNDTVALPLKRIEELVLHVREVKVAAGRMEDPSALRAMLVDLAHTLETVFSRYVQPEESTQVRDLTQKLNLLKDTLTETSEARVHVEKDLAQLRESTIRLHEEARAHERERYEKKVERASYESRLAGLRGEARALNERKAEFEREQQEAMALVGHEAFAYEPWQGEVVLHEQHESERRLARMKIRVEEFGGGSEDVLKEFEETKARDAFLSKELDDLAQSEVSLQTLITDLDRELNAIFNEGLIKINASFNEYFTILFGGGSAKLTIVELEERGRGDDDAVVDEEEKEEGIDIAISVPKKRVKGLTALSGGERALTSIALIFAMSSVNPPPFLILDETDAALDEANSRRYGDMLTALSKRSQLVVITHNRETMSRAGVLYGVTMGHDGVSTLLSVRFEEAVRVAK